MSAPLIALTAYAPDEKGRVALPAAYGEAVRRAGGVPVLLPPGEKRLKDFLARVDGVILTGGGDVNPALYGGRANEKIYMVSRERDEMEGAIIRDALKSQRPLFGICRGSQVINVALGGTLIEHLPDEVGENVLHREEQGKAIPHDVSPAPGGRLEKILGRKSFSAASSHHQAVRKLGKKLRLAAKAADGVVEGFELPGHPWLVGVQWHPEMTAAEDPLQQKLFDDFVKAAALYRRKHAA